MTEETDAPARKRGLWGVPLPLAIVLAAGLLMSPVLLYRPYSIPSAAMEPTLTEGDVVLARRTPPRTPRRGDLVVFRHPTSRDTWVKRLIGLPGDRVQMRGGLLYLNGAPVPRTHLGDAVETGLYGITRTVGKYREALDGQAYLTNDFGPDEMLDETPEYVVPEGFYFMLGDNRDNSADSRVPVEQQGVGFVPAGNLIGRIGLVLWSPKRGKGVFRP